MAVQQMHQPASWLIQRVGRDAGLDALGTQDRFSAYFETCRKPQSERREQIELFVAFEAEVYSDYEPFLEGLLAKLRPDYIVGSVHHVNDVPIDMSTELYADAIDRAGDIESLYCDYFDLVPGMDATSLTSSPVINRAVSIVWAQRSPSEPEPDTSPSNRHIRGVSGPAQSCR